MTGNAPQQSAGLSEEMKRIINGEVTPEEKNAAYQGSLQRWWQEYAGRKNEEEDMVADSLMYDERCHLPRTTAGPRFDADGADALALESTAPTGQGGHAHAHAHTHGHQNGAANGAAAAQPAAAAAAGQQQQAKPAGGAPAAPAAQ